MQRHLEYWPIEKLKPSNRNARTHSKKQLEQLRRCISDFGFINPVLVDGRGKIVAGHGRVAAAKQLGLAEIPVLVVDHLSEEQIRLFAIADNKIAENAGWDREVLRLELKELSDCTGIDLRITGFETPEIDLLILDGTETEPADDVPLPDSNIPTISRLGDLWQIGDHRLICGNATDPEAYRRLLNGQLADQIFTDPPYNVPIGGHVSGLGKIKHAEFVMASGEMNSDEFAAFLESVMKLLVQNSANGSLHYVCMDWRHIGETLRAGKSAYSEFKNLCVWNKTNAGMGSFYRSQHELVFVFKNGDEPHTNNIELGRHGRYRTNVWNYPGQNSFNSSRTEELAMHPTVKPVAMVADAIADASHRTDIVLDAFAGSGTTLLAAQRMGRHGYGIELSPRYVDLAIRRLESRYGLSARHTDLGTTFDETGRARGSEQ
jgi:DNA modification methylase